MPRLRSRSNSPPGVDLTTDERGGHGRAAAKIDDMLAFVFENWLPLGVTEQAMAVAHL
jgi:hypothetical protein